MKEQEESRNQVVHEHYYGCWGDCANLFGMGHRWMPLAWGVILLVIGGVWLAANVFGIEDWGRWVGSILLLGIGLALLLTRAGRSEQMNSSSHGRR